MQQTASKDGDELLRKVKAGFLLQGRTLSAFCRENNIDDGNVYRALRGEWKGSAGKAVREKVVAAAGLSRIRPIKKIKHGNEASK